MKILLLTDFSLPSRNAISYGVNMFRHADATFILLNIYLEPGGSADALSSVADVMEKQSKGSLHREHEWLKEKFRDDLSIETRSLYGALPELVNQIAESEAIDFVVMGTTGAGKSQKEFMGSNTKAVIRKIKAPILAIPEGVTFTPPVRIAFAADYAALKDKYLLQPLATIASQYESALMVINIRPKKVQASEEQIMENIKLNSILADIPHKFYINENDNVVAGINDFVHENEADMLVMIARQHNVFEQMMKKSVSHEYTRIADRPVLILHES